MSGRICHERFVRKDLAAAKVLTAGEYVLPTLENIVPATEKLFLLEKTYADKSILTKVCREIFVRKILS